MKRIIAVSVIAVILGTVVSYAAINRNFDTARLEEMCISRVTVDEVETWALNLQGWSSAADGTTLRSEKTILKADLPGAIRTGIIDLGDWATKQLRNQAIGEDDGTWE